MDFYLTVFKACHCTVLFQSNLFLNETNILKRFLHRYFLYLFFERSKLNNQTFFVVDLGSIIRRRDNMKFISINLTFIHFVRSFCLKTSLSSSTDI